MNPRPSASELFGKLERMEKPIVGDLYRHRESGSLYVVENISLDEEDPSRALVTYRQHNTVYSWTRSMKKFMDGRYEHIPKSRRVSDETISDRRKRVTKIPACFARAGFDNNSVPPALLHVDRQAVDLSQLFPLRWHQDPEAFFPVQDDRDHRSLEQRRRRCRNDAPAMYRITVTVEVQQCDSSERDAVLGRMSDNDRTAVHDLLLQWDKDGLKIEEKTARLMARDALATEKVALVVSKAKERLGADIQEIELEHEPDDSAGSYRFWVTIRMREDASRDINRMLDLEDELSGQIRPLMETVQNVSFMLRPAKENP